MYMSVSPFLDPGIARIWHARNRPAMFAYTSTERRLQRRVSRRCCIATIITTFTVVSRTCRRTGRLALHLTVAFELLAAEGFIETHRGRLLARAVDELGSERERANRSRRIRCGHVLRAATS